MVPSITFKDVEDKRAFYNNVLAPERSAQNQWLKDWNGDGSRDWRDLAFQRKGSTASRTRTATAWRTSLTLILEDFNDLVSDRSTASSGTRAICTSRCRPTSGGFATRTATA